MQFCGKILAIWEVSETNNWEKTISFIVEEKADSQYPSSMGFQIYKKIEMLEGYNVGDELEVSYWSKAKEYNGKFYTTLSPWKITGNKGGKVEVKEKADVVTKDETLPF